MIRADRSSTPWIQLSLKIVQVVTLVVGLLLAAAWSSQGVHFTDLNADDYNVHASFEYYIVVAILGILYPIVAVVIFFPIRRDLPPAAVLAATSLLTFFLLIAAIVLSVSVANLSGTQLVRGLGLDLTAPEAACAFAFISLLVYIADLVLEVIEAVFIVKKGSMGDLIVCGEPPEKPVKKVVVA